MWRAIFEKLLIAFYFLRLRFGSQFKTRAQLETWQQQKLNKLLKFVTVNSKFYQERLREPFVATPFIDKSDMMKHFDTLNTRQLHRDQAIELAIASEKSRDFSPMIGDITVGLSSGTSGHRGLFCADFYERARYAGTILAKALPRKKQKGPHRVAFFLRANSNLYKTVQSRTLEFHYFDMLIPLEAHLQALESIKPTLVIGPPSMLRMLAQHILAKNLKLPQVQRVFSVAEVLDPIDEKLISRAFDQKIHQIYQCTEGFLAISCELGSLHLNEDLVIVEKEWINRSENKFVPILTDLYRRTQPVIRYRLNDILTEDPTPCPCGSVMTRLKMIEGRCDDMLEFPKGETKQSVFPDFVRNSILYASDLITEYRVTQSSDGSLTIALKGEGDIKALEMLVTEQLNGLAKKLNSQLPPVQFLHEFPQLGGNKLRRIIREPLNAHLPL